jgi:hypothetical protein
MVEV